MTTVQLYMYKKRSSFLSFIVLYIPITLSEVLSNFENKMTTVQLYIYKKEAIFLVSYFYTFR